MEITGGKQSGREDSQIDSDKMVYELRDESLTNPYMYWNNYPPPWEIPFYQGVVGQEQGHAQGLINQESCSNSSC